MTASACRAVQAIQQCGIDNSNEYPRVARALAPSFYMDDYVDSFNTIEEAQQTRAELEKAQATGGFELASHPELLMEGELNEQKEIV